ncbi:MAG: cytochrome c1 [Legionellaceae bacterium]|nr:cytochrome c1 [Legionellaceae bacterium]
MRSLSHQVMTCSILFCLYFMVSLAYGDEITQRKHGEQLFKDYCNGCHTLRYMSHPSVSLPSTEAISWFGKLPPDLSLIARVRGTDWLIAYLTGFYPDKHRPFGSNNRVIHDVLMPNVLFPLQEPSCESHNNNRGEMSFSSYQQAVQDIVIFLVFVAEPSRIVRYKLGFAVVGFLAIFLLLYWRLIRHKKNKL